MPNIPQPGYSNSTTNKYLLQDWSQTSGNAISTKLLGHVFTPQENSDWVSVITQDVKHNGWLIPRIWLQIYETVAHYPEVQSDLDNFQAQILDRTSANFDMQWTNWAQDTMAHGYSLDQMRSNLAHSDAATSKLISLYQKDASAVPTEADINTQEDKLASGTSFSSLEQSFAYSAETRSAATALIQRESGITTPSTSLVDYFSQQIAGGKSYSDMVVTFAYGGEVRGAATAIIQNEADIQAPSSGLLDYFSRNIASGKSLQDMKVSFAYGNEVTTALGESSVFFRGHPIDQSGLSAWQGAIANGESLATVYSAMAQSPEAWAQLRNVYAGWGQVPPTDAQLKTAGQAMFKLHAAWIITKDQTGEQLQAEAAQYQALSGKASYDEILNSIASSQTEATAVMASELSDPMANAAPTSEQFRQIVSQGGAPVPEIITDQADVQNNIHDVEQDEQGNPCEPATFKAAHSQDVHNSAIAAVNADPDRMMAGVHTNQWSSGVQWVSDGNGIQAQGNPFEVWDADRLKGQSYFWLADYNAERSNWRASDEWQETSGTAVSDKTMDLNVSSYKDRSDDEPASMQFMRGIQGRLLANVQQMIRYDSDGGEYRYTTNFPEDPQLSFGQGQISHYMLDLGVPSEPTDNQWKAICLALQKAEIRAAAYGKTIDFAVKDIRQT